MNKREKRRIEAEMAEFGCWIPPETDRMNREAMAGRTPYEPPAGAQVLSVWKEPARLGSAKVTNLTDLFNEPLCSACGHARGRRLDVPLEVSVGDPASRFADGFLATPRGAIHPEFAVYSQDFVDQLGDSERAHLDIRPVVRLGRTKKPLVEVVGSSVHVPVVLLRGGNPWIAKCAECGWTGPPDYGLPGCLPRWLYPYDDAIPRGQPSFFVRESDLPEGTTVITIDGIRGFDIAFSADRWSVIAKQKHVVAASRAIDVGVVPDEVTEPPEEAAA